MAFILGIYTRLLEALRAFDLELVGLLCRGRLRAAAGRVDAAFLLLFGTGIVGALGFFTRIVRLPELIYTHPQLVYSVFFGLISTSLYLLLRSVADIRLRDAAWVFAGGVAGAALVSAVPASTPESTWFVFLCGAVAICAAILPGISGSFVLLVLEKYGYILGAVARFDLSVLAPFALGAACAVVLFSRMLLWCLHRFHRHTLLVMSGIVLGSLYWLWPFQERSYERVGGRMRLVRSEPVWPESLDGALLASLALAAAAALAVLAMHRLAQRTAGGR